MEKKEEGKEARKKRREGGKKEGIAQVKNECPGGERKGSPEAHAGGSNGGREEKEKVKLKGVRRRREKKRALRQGERRKQTLPRKEGVRGKECAGGEGRREAFGEAQEAAIGPGLHSEEKGGRNKDEVPPSSSSSSGSRETLPRGSAIEVPGGECRRCGAPRPFVAAWLFSV